MVAWRLCLDKTRSVGLMYLIPRRWYVCVKKVHLSLFVEDLRVVIAANTMIDEADGTLSINFTPCPLHVNVAELYLSAYEL